MKKVLVFAVYMLLMGTINTRAQVASISIAGLNETVISNLAINDFIGADNRIGYAASFDITISSSDNVKVILSELQSCASGGKKLSITISRANFNFELEEQREYASASVEQMSLTEMDASSKSVAKVSVEIKSAVMSLRPGKGDKRGLFGAKAKAAITSNFQFTLGSLPARRISKISTLNIGQQNEFVIELTGADAKEWYNWLQKNGTGNPKTEMGSLSLLGPDLKETLISINISDVLITSYSFAINESGGGAARPGGQESIAKVTIGLRAGSVLFNK